MDFANRADSRSFARSSTTRNPRLEVNRMKSRIKYSPLCIPGTLKGDARRREERDRGWVAAAWGRGAGGRGARGRWRRTSRKRRRGRKRWRSGRRGRADSGWDEAKQGSLYLITNSKSPAGNEAAPTRAYLFFAIHRPPRCRPLPLVPPSRAFVLNDAENALAVTPPFSTRRTEK